MSRGPATNIESYATLTRIAGEIADAGSRIAYGEIVDSEVVSPRIIKPRTYVCERPNHESTHGLTADLQVVSNLNTVS